ncbi:MAG: hypothetical protein ISN29_06400 [Gammaproteobacteria bacterium AqS3]|nr:hypothetical protein [Gammaproteobacteria bacterium AqS3]
MEGRLRRRWNKTVHSITKRWDRFRTRRAGAQLSQRAGTIEWNAVSEAPLPGRAAAGSEGVTVILNTYERSHYMQSQIEAIRAQSVVPDEIWIWSNRGATPQTDLSGLCDRFVVSNYNWKFFGRFALGLMAETRYINWIDDDMLPGERWLENCINTIETAETCGPLGGMGMRIPASGIERKSDRIGWRGPYLEQAQEVDFIGHTWFLRRDWLELMWREMPYTLGNSEDMHLCYSAQKYGGLKTFVPPHPPGQNALWSNSSEAIGVIRGGDEQKHSSDLNHPGHDDERNAVIAHYRANGWQLLCERE